MITILTTVRHQKQIEKIIESVERLNELVTIAINKDEVGKNSALLIREHDSIRVELDWLDNQPPYLFPTIKFSSENLCALVFYQLGNSQKAFEYLSKDSELYTHLLIATYLRLGYEISEELFSTIDSLHNRSIVNYYGNYPQACSADQLKKLFKKAIHDAESNELKVFTAKYFINFLLDTNFPKEAEQLIKGLPQTALSLEAKNALDIQLASVLMSQLALPYDKVALNNIIELFQQGINFYESKNLTVNAGLLYIEASEVANFQGDYTKSEMLIRKAIRYFKDEKIPELVGEAVLRQATLYYTWSKEGKKQYYRPAINSFQDSLKVFKKDTHPRKFADAHHHLALIYSEMPVSSQEKYLWSAFSASSFKEALNFYTKDSFPYEYASISHNYATALMGFPEAKLHNNLEKAATMFEEALAIRTATSYPLERALTLLNQLELYWITHNENEEVEHQKHQIMVNNAKEIMNLVGDKSLLEKADKHLEALKKVEKTLH